MLYSLMNALKKYLFPNPLLILLISIIPSMAFAETIETRLISENKTIQPGTPFWVAVKQTLQPEWHTYWRNPGEAGYGTELTWQLPDGFKASPIYWPVPKTFKLGNLVNYGYENEVYLLTQITPPDNLPNNTPIQLRVLAEWLLCNTVCIPGQAILSTTVIVKNEPPTLDPKQTEAFKSARQQLPQQLDNWDIQASKSEDTINLSLTPKDKALYNLKYLYYFDNVNRIDPSAEQILTKEGDTYNLALTINPDNEQGLAMLSGVLYNPAGWLADGSFPALKVQAGFDSDFSPLLMDLKASPGFLGFLRAITFAFIGGLILNLMPCVFPVLSIKIIGFIKQTNQKPKKIKCHGIMFTFGVLMSFWALSGLLLLLRAGGLQIGWGFQLQSPYFILFLAVLLFTVGLNFAGVFEFGASLMGLGSKYSQKSGYKGSFFSGILATLVATPCTAPFMGVALGYALTLKATQTFAIFTALAIGMATPYLILSFIPKWLKWLPRPGPWMESFKQAMAFPMLATVLWLLWVFALQTSLSALIQVLFGLLILSLAIWIYGRWAHINQKSSTRRKGQLFAIIFLVISFSTLWKATETPIVPETSGGSKLSYGIEWLPYSEEIIEELRQEGYPVYLDFTAAWCITCQSNKKIVFGSQDVLDRFEELNIKAVKADWTRYDPAITKALESFGRSGVPLNIIYPADSTQPAIILPELLTPNIVLNALEKLKD